MEVLFLELLWKVQNVLGDNVVEVLARVNGSNMKEGKKGGN